MKTRLIGLELDTPGATPCTDGGAAWPAIVEEFKQKQKTSDRPRPLNEDLSGLNKSYVKFRSIYQSGRKYSAKEWVELMTDLLDSID